MAERYGVRLMSGAAGRIKFRPFGAVLAIMVLVTLPAGALAQQVAVLVNGAPITTYDIEQRAKLIQLSTHKAAPRQEIVEELISEKIKIQEGKRFGVEATDAEVEKTIANMGSRTGMGFAQFAQALAHDGIAIGTLKSRIRADIVWTQIVRGRYATLLQPDEKDVVEAMKTKGKDGDTVGYDYSLRPILFLVPKGSPSSVVEARVREAEGLRARFQSCDEGIVFTRGIPDVAVRDPVTRTSADLIPQLREILDNTPVGRLTKPEVTAQGVELFALCEKKATTADTPQKRGARMEILSSRFETQSKRYLNELRRSAMIEFK
jgi:peptidyl-prolyl cis-trans isomerase SurA